MKVTISLPSLFLFILNIIKTESYVVCSSITLQGNIHLSKIQKIRSCSIIVGHLRIINSKFIDFNLASNSSDSFFPNLAEITDYLLIFQAHGVKNLNALFPKLTLIRGDKLFKQSYALVVFLTNSLQQLNLASLMEIKHGSVLFSRLYNACYLNTIDWSYIIKDANALKPTLSQSNSECLTQICPKDCPANCWSEQSCQFKCAQQCETNCKLARSSSHCFCSNSLCKYCTKDETCLTCSKFRDLTTGNCVEQCPKHTLIYENHSCIKSHDCSTASSSLVKNYFQLDDRHCVRQCPHGFRPVLDSITASYTNLSLPVQKCVQCEDKACKKDCSEKSFHLKNAIDLESIKNCHKIRKLVLEIENVDLNQQQLSENMQYLEEIREYALITRNRFLSSLRFLRSLRLIRGETLFENKYALFVHTNRNLNELWSLNSSQILINGSVKFFENPQLCFQDIESFLNRSENFNPENSDISFNFNGHERLNCNSKFPIELTLEPFSNHVLARWNVTISDLRRLNGYILYFIEIKSGKSLIIDKESNWSSLYIEFNENMAKKSKHVQAKFECEPYTKYAVYLRADLTFSSHFNQTKQFFGRDRLISEIHFVVSSASQPSRPENIIFEGISYDQGVLKWEPPKKPNGIIDSYFIAYAKINDAKNSPRLLNTDPCQTEITDNFEPALNRSFSSKSSPSRTNNSFDNVNRVWSNNKQFSSNEKLDLISVEDEIYNLAFRRSNLNHNNNVSISSSKKPNKSIGFSNLSANVSNTTQIMSNIPNKNETASLNADLLGLDLIHESLLRLVRQDLMIENDNERLGFHLTTVSYLSTSLQLTKLVSFGRYIVSIIACQNLNQTLQEYLRNFNPSPESRKSLNEFLSSFSFYNYCSKPSSTTFRSLPNPKLNEIVEVKLYKDFDDSWIFNWSKPDSPNGQIYNYNIKFTDLKLNKILRPICHSQLDNLRINLNQFLLSQGHEYLIQVQAVSTAGFGPWSSQVIKYSVPILSKLYIKLIQISIALSTLITLLLLTLILLRKYTKIKERGYFSIKSHYYYFKSDEWELKRENLIIEERIGSGCFSEVNKGKLRLKNNALIDCAIKFCGSDPQSRQRLLKEAHMMKSINATHIVKLLGVVSRENPSYLVLEYMDKGDLKEYLKNYRLQNTDLQNGMLKQEISMNRFYRMAAEIADGMLWLSEHKYIHRDLAARNCLLSSNDIIKIADLGLSKNIYKDSIYNQKCKSLLPIRWMPPESLLHGASTTKSDVWSYGVVVWEMATYGENPYVGKENEEVIEFVKNGGKLELPANAPFKFFVILSKCLTHEDYKRAGFKEILDILDPDLTSDFKKTSFYHNEFTSKSLNQNTQEASSLAANSSVKIAQSYIENSDNYM